MKVFNLIAQLTSVYCFDHQGLTMADIQKLENGTQFDTRGRSPRRKLIDFK